MASSDEIPGIRGILNDAADSFLVFQELNPWLQVMNNLVTLGLCVPIILSSYILHSIMVVKRRG
jgi:hypothetical protein